MRKTIFTLILGFLSILTLHAQESITNVTAAQRTDGSKMVDITYDLAGPEPGYFITVEVSFDEGGAWQQVTKLEGDVTAVVPGEDKQIIWKAGLDFPDGFNIENVLVKVHAELPDWECGSVLVDSRDGKEYQTVQIGGQCWMAENLNVGTRIDVNINMNSGNGLIEKYCYDDDDANCNLYGGLYQWSEANNEGINDICPDGWHLPSSSQFSILTNYFGDNNSSSGTGGKFKSTCTEPDPHPRWDDPNVGATNESGFSGLPGGVRYSSFSGAYYNLLGEWANFWSSTLYMEDSYCLTLKNSESKYYWNEFDSDRGASVRCIYNIIPNQPPIPPRNPDPEIGEVVPVDNTLSWYCTDPENDPLTFDVYIGTEETPGLVANGLTNATYVPDDLEYGTTYYWKILAHDDQGNTTEGPVWSFETEILFICGDTLIDSRDGQKYKTVKIGAQCWMAENLKYLPNVSPSSNGSQTDPYYYVYDYQGSNVTEAKNTENFNNYGVLYNFTAANSACPSGWRLPSSHQYDDDSDWNILINYFGGDDIAGGELKNTRTFPDPQPRWDSPNTGATNLSGFSALPGGYRTIDYGFWYMGAQARFCGKYTATNAHYIKLLYSAEIADVLGSNIAEGLSVRCLLDKDIDNYPPNLPSDPIPADGVSGQSLETTLEWSCSDPDDNNSQLTYDIYFDIIDPPNVMIGQVNGITAYNLESLESNTTYYWKIIAADNHGNTTEGTIWNFTTKVELVGFNCGDTFTDNRDGQEYETIEIGNQCWMAENLNIGTRVNTTIDMTDNGVVEKWCYNNELDNCDSYGGLYQWNEMMDYFSLEGVQGICPDGFHLPSDADWVALVDYVISEGYPNIISDPNGSGNALESCRQVNSPFSGGCNTTVHPRWNSNSSHHGFDAFGFSALPGGYIENGNAWFYQRGEGGYWWTSTQKIASKAYYYGLWFADGEIYDFYQDKDDGFSVRCLLND